MLSACPDIRIGRSWLQIHQLVWRKLDQTEEIFQKLLKATEE